MAGKQAVGDGLPANLAGMSKNQLYDIMSQMKSLIEQNQHQAREILIQNPLLTKALFQAQIMLGMVQPPKAIPNIQSTVSQSSTQSLPPSQQANIQVTHALPGQNGLQDQTNASQVPTPVRRQHQSPAVMPIPSTSAPPSSLQPQPLPSHALQSVQHPKGHVSAQATPMTLPQSSQFTNIAPLPLHSASQLPPLQPPMPTSSNQMQQPLQTSSIPHLPLQPPLPPQPRPSMQAFSHQPQSQMGQAMNFQQSGAPQMHHSQPMFHLGGKIPANMGPSFPQGQPAIPNQPPPQSLYQVGGSHLGTEFSSQAASSMPPPERGPGWMPGLSDNPTGTQLPGPPPMLAPGQMGQGSQPPRPPALTPEMEKALLQQVMSLTPEQINLLPPEQRSQVLQLQQMLRQ